MSTTSSTTQVDNFSHQFFHLIPFSKEAKMEMEFIAPGKVKAKLPFRASFADVSGALDAGVIAALIDTAAGAATVSLFDTAIPTATLNLRMDVCGAIEPGHDVYVVAEVVARQEGRIWVDAAAYHSDVTDPAILARGTFTGPSSSKAKTK